MSASILIVLAPDGILTAAQFRQLQPAFADSSVYTDDGVTLYLQLAASMLDPARWQDWRPLGMALMVAHYMALDRREELIAAKGGVPGQGSIGIMTSKSIGQVSASYDIMAGTELNAGHWNLTTFGRRYIHMARLVGAGGIQVTGDNLQGINTDRHGPIF